MGRKQRPKHSKSPGTMNIILALMGAFLLAFIVAMVVVFVHMGSVPDTLIGGVFALCGGECGIMGWIKNQKEKVQDRKWELDDRKEREDKNA